MSPLILNRDFAHPADGWYMIEPLGEHPNRPAKLVQVIDAAAATAIVNRFNQDAEAPGFAGMLVDHEHFKQQADQESRAYGWLMKLQNRADGIYGQIRWTTTGRAAVDGGDYRFFSSEYDPADLVVLYADKPRRIRPLRLDGLTLTNEPNNKGGRPITNRAAPPTLPAAVGGAANPHTKMKDIAKLLGLSEDAAVEAVSAEIVTLKNRAALAATLETETQALRLEQVDAELAAAGITDAKVINRIKPILSDPAQCKNRDARKDFLADLMGLVKPPAPAAQPAAAGRVLNRQSAALANADTTAEADPAARVEKIRNRATELQKNGLKFDAAWAQASVEVK